MPFIWIAGDSTASNKSPDKRPESGWGEHLERYMNSTFVIENVAENGRSSKSFIDEGRLDFIEKHLEENDFLLIQFGHNDQKVDDPKRYADPYNDYPRNLMKFVDVARRHGAIPVLMTPITRRHFIGGQLNPLTHLDYPQAVRMLAQEENIYLIDLFKLTQDIVKDMGEEASTSLFLHLSPGVSKNYPHGIIDNTHLNRNGAERIASIIAEHLKKIRA